jgi:hypothetical protein
MRAEPLINERFVLDARSFVEIVVWRVPRPVPGSKHEFRYRLALVIDEVCVPRYDNEAGKGDHRHIAGVEESYAFIDAETMLEDFWRDVEELMK